MKPKRILITSDLLRVTGKKASRNEFATNTTFFAALLTSQISAAARIPISLFEWNDDTLAFDGKAVYDLLGRTPDLEGWTALYEAEATPDLCSLFRPHVEDALVIGFEIAPILQNVLTMLDIPFIDFRWHPLRFLDDIFFGLSSNRPAISDAIARYALSAQDVDFHVGLHRASAIRRRGFRTQAPFAGTLLVGQTPFDASLVHDKRIATWQDYEQSIAALTQTGPVAFRPHPFSPEPLPALSALLERHGVAVVDSSTDMYSLLSGGSLTKVVSLSSGTLEEAAFFGIPVSRLIPQRFRYLPEPPGRLPADGASRFYTGVYHEFLDVDFWADILRPELETTWRNDRPIPLKPDRLRNVNGSYWGYLGSGGTNLVMPYNTPE